MANEFGPEASEVTTLNSNVTAKEGVSKGNTFLGGVANLFDAAGAAREEQRVSDVDRVVTDFTSKQLAIAEGFAQGRISSSAHARTRMRSNLMSYIDANPGARKELISAQSSILGLSGGAKIVAEGDRQEQLRFARQEQLISANLISHDADEAEFDRVNQITIAAEAAKERHTVRMNTLNEQLKLNTLEQSERTRLESLKRAEDRRLILDTAPAEFEGMKTAFNNIVNGAGSETDKLMAVEDHYTNFLSQVSEQFGALESNESSAMMKPFEMMFESYKKRATGELSDAELKRDVESTMAISEKIALSDPTVARLVTVKKLFGDNVFVGAMGRIDQEAYDASMRFILGATEDSELAENPFSEKPAVKTAVTEVLGGSMRMLLDGGPEEKAEAAEIIASTIESVEDYSNILAKNPKAGFALVDWMSSPDFLKSLRADPGAFGDLSGAAEVVNRHYADEVWGMVRNELDLASVAIWPDRPEFTGGPVDNTERLPEFTPAGVAVGARTTPTGVDFYAIDAENPTARAKAKDLNAKLKPVINKTLHAMSHLEGTDDYSGMWEQVSQEFLQGFGQEPQGPRAPSGGDFSDDLSLSDFSFPTVSKGGLPDEVADDAPFLDEVERVADKYEIEPSVLLAVMDFETGGSFSPSQKNAAGSSGTGLIQFMSQTAKDLGTTTDELSSLSRADQMKYVDKYLSQWDSKIRGGSAEDVYMAVLFPKAANKPSDYVLFREGTKAYTQNKGLDRNGDGTITKEEAAKRVVSLVGNHE